MSSKFDGILQKLNIPNTHREIFFLSILLFFCLFVRIVPPTLITLITLVTFLSIFALDFYIYANKCLKDETTDEKTTEFSWGFIREKKDLMDIQTFLNYLYNKDQTFYKNYLAINFSKFVIIAFIFGDLLIAFKDLDMKNAGIYIAMSMFTKFVFIGYVLMKETFNKVLIGEKNTEDNVLEIYNTQMNAMLSFFAVIFIFFFILSKTIVEIFFGDSFLPSHTSLPFILLGNIALVVGLCIYDTSKKINKRVTQKISRVFALFVFILFVFMSIDYIDSVTYFVVGSSALLSIFLYNFVIKKPGYIERTYNLTL